MCKYSYERFNKGATTPTARLHTGTLAYTRVHNQGRALSTHIQLRAHGGQRYPLQPSWSCSGYLQQQGSRLGYLLPLAGYL